MDHDQPNVSRSPHDLERDNQLRRQLDEATPSLGLFGLIAGAMLILALAVYLFGSPVSDNATVATRDTVQAPAPSSPPINP